jgi:hypothetical protein
MTDKPVRYMVSDGELTLMLEVAEEGGYCVTSPFDDGVTTQAETLEEAFEMARDAIETLRVGRKKLLARRTSKKKTG